REGGNPDNLLFLLDSRLRGNDKKGLISSKMMVFGQTLLNKVMIGGGQECPPSPGIIIKRTI
ncbi:MAG: hypothetical protein P9X24_12165, partial [Candidatus Hatepunaea meridiana]|nr:hypothetical protein [Candidatus Hatepunaea meridiana]